MAHASRSNVWKAWCLLLMLPLSLPSIPALSTPSSSASAIPVTKVAVIGTTGRLAREAIRQLSAAGVETRCLLRHDPDRAHSDKDEISSSKTSLVTELSALPGVTMVSSSGGGVVNDPVALHDLVEGTTACLALYGPGVPRPWWRALVLPSFLYPDDDPIRHPGHPRQVNFVGLKNVLTAMEASDTCRHIVRVTGKGETPWSFFSILINALSGIAKGWNYEGEQVLRSQSAIDYTILRPGVMKDTLDDVDIVDGSDGKQHDKTSKDAATIGGKSVRLGLLDNGGDLPVSAVSYSQIAKLAVDVLGRSNCRRTTLTAMNVDASSDLADTVQTVDTVTSDTRDFPSTLLDQHKKAARVGGLTFMAVLLLVAKGTSIVLGKLLAVVLNRLL